MEDFLEELNELETRARTAHKDDWGQEAIPWQTYYGDAETKGLKWSEPNDDNWMVPDVCDGSYKQDALYIAYATPTRLLNIISVLRTLLTEQEEQARLLGMSSSRELSLLTQIKELKSAIVEHLSDGHHVGERSARLRALVAE